MFQTNICCTLLCKVDTTYYSNFFLRTLSCNKLSHCLFDFDCSDLNVYVNEVYNYQQFLQHADRQKEKGMIHNPTMRSTKTSHDTLLIRKDVKITYLPYSDYLASNNR